MRTRQLLIGRGRLRPAGSTTGVMGILNVTPDSFSDGGRFASIDRVVEVGREMARQGACLLDVGGESTRPGAEEVSVEEELRRTVPAIRALVERVGLPVSIDTRKAEVFTAAWEAGASMLNDVSGLAFDAGLASAAARTDAGIVLMHGRGDPATMDAMASYGDLVADVASELRAAVHRARSAGIDPARIVLDPGLGFAKDAAQNWELLTRLEELRDLGFPLLVGPSRKRFLGAVTGHRDPSDRDVATAVIVGHLAAQGVEMVRVHAVGHAVDAVAVGTAMAGGFRQEEPAR